MAASFWEFLSAGTARKAASWLQGDEHHAAVQPTIEGAVVNAAAPLPVREPAFGSIIAQGTVTIATTSTTLRAADGSRRFLIVSNGGATAVWVHFGAVAAVVGSGVLLPAGAKDVYYTNMEVRAIAVTSSNVVGFVAV
jgi:hypothetical protein